MNKTIKEFCKEAHETAISKGFWEMIPAYIIFKKDGKIIQKYKLRERNDGELIALMHCELSEALEALRHTDKSKNNVGEELADCCIRIFDYCEARDIDL